jgi:hypothetical protein
MGVFLDTRSSYRHVEALLQYLSREKGGEAKQKKDLIQRVKIVKIIRGIVVNERLKDVIPLPASFFSWHVDG